MAVEYGWEPFQTWRILECLNITEYNALTDTKKDYVRLIISAGTINFRENSPIWNALHVIFPDGTASWTSILEAATRIYNPLPE